MARKRRPAKRKTARAGNLPVTRKKATKVKAGGGDEVIVAYQSGTVRSAVVLGSLWKGGDRPPTSRT